MATTKRLIDYLLDQLSSLPGVRAHKMFGEYALYFDEKVVALVCDNQLFVKVTPPGKTLVGDRYREGEPYFGAKPAMLVGFAEIDSSRLCELIRATAIALPAPKPAKPRKTKAARYPHHRRFDNWRPSVCAMTIAVA